MSAPIKKFEMDYDSNGSGPWMVEDVDGDYVLHSDHLAIIDGLRGELRSLEEYAAGRMNKNHDLRQQLKQQAQRIGELEGLLLRTRDYFTECGLPEDLADEYRAAIVELPK